MLLYSNDRDTQAGHALVLPDTQVAHALVLPDRDPQSGQALE